MKAAPWIIIVLLLAVIILMRECTPVPNCPECPEVDTVTIVVHDSIPYPVTEYVPKIIYKNHFTEVGKLVDTNAIIAEFITRNYYIDTLVNDTNALVIVEDTVSQNRIIWRKKQVSIFPPSVYKTTIVTKQADPRRKLFVGIGVGRSAQSFGLAPSLLYISKRETAYSLSFDVVNNDAYFTLYFKLNFNRE